MATDRLRNTLAHLRRALAPPERDGQLLARFVATRDEAAFAALVRRHGPMVLGVCRRVLGHAQDAEDAFQATFLVLARKAGSVLKRDVVGGWLYAVAYRTAGQVRKAQARRRARERQVPAMPHPPVEPPEDQDWRPLLDQELGRLPEKYRVPLVLCDLEGLSRRAAAGQLGLADGTLSRRLAAGRRLLAGRLSRRGVALSVGALALALTQTAAAVPAPVVNATAKAAVLVVAGKSAAVATPAALLMNEVLGAMLMSKLKTYMAVALVAVALGIGGLAYRAAGQGTGRPEARPLTDVEVLQREMAILKAQVELLQDQARRQQADLRALQGRAGGAGAMSGSGMAMGGAGAKPGPGGTGTGATMGRGGFGTPGAKPADDAKRMIGMMGGGGYLRPLPGGTGPAAGRVDEPTTGNNRLPTGEAPDPVRQAEEALRQLRRAPDAAARERAADALERAVRRLRARPDSPANR
jgi:RNA polymerase sigma factor (sigma-70 family)